MFPYKFLILIAICTISNFNAQAFLPAKCDELDPLNQNTLANLSKAIIPELSGKKKGDAGKVLVIGGSVEYTGAPYFAAISALKVGADLVYVITTESAAPVIKSYSPDLIVHPIRNMQSLTKIKSLLAKVHVVVIGPGLGREDEDVQLVFEVIEACKILKKPLVIDADGLYAVSKNVSVLKDFPAPGTILTPNHVEARRLKQAVSDDDEKWFNYWGPYVTVLEKGHEDQYHSSIEHFSWSNSKGGSGRRAGGQGDILAGSLATFFHWAIQSNLCDSENSAQLDQSVATYAAAKFTRICNYKAFIVHGRSMTASDMLNEIHRAFTDLFLIAIIGM